MSDEDRDRYSLNVALGFGLNSDLTPMPILTVEDPSSGIMFQVPLPNGLGMLTEAVVNMSIAQEQIESMIEELQPTTPEEVADIIRLVHLRDKEVENGQGPSQ